MLPSCNNRIAPGRNRATIRSTMRSGSVNFVSNPRVVQPITCQIQEHAPREIRADSTSPSAVETIAVVPGSLFDGRLCARQIFAQAGRRKKVCSIAVTERMILQQMTFASDPRRQFRMRRHFLADTKKCRLHSGLRAMSQAKPVSSADPARHRRSARRHFNFADPDKRPKQSPLRKRHTESQQHQTTPPHGTDTVQKPSAAAAATANTAMQTDDAGSWQNTTYRLRATHRQRI